MLQCRACNSWNDDAVAFCGQCGQPVSGKGRKGWGLRQVAILSTGLLAMVLAALILQARGESGRVADRPDPEAAAGVKPVVEKSLSPSKSPVAGKLAAAADRTVSAGEVTPVTAEPRRVDVGRALATLVLLDKEGSPEREVPAVVVHPDGVVLSRYSHLVGVYKVNCRRDGVKGSIPVTGIIRYNQPADLVLLRLARTRDPLPALDMLGRSGRQEIANEDEIEVYDGPGARLARIAEVFFTTADGHSGILLEDSRGTICNGISSSLQIRQEWMGPAPPATTRGNSRGSEPRLMVISRTPCAMLVQTMRYMPAAASRVESLSGLAIWVSMACLAASTSSLILPPAKKSGFR